MKKGGFMKDALILFVITLVAGICLGGVYEITKGPIEVSKMAAKIDAYKMVYADAADFKTAPDLDEQVKASADLLAGTGFGNVMVDDIVVALDASGGAAGYVVTSTSRDGYGGDITITVGVSADGTVKGIEFLALNETAGLGMNAANDSFKGQFSNKTVDSFTVVKGGASADNEIDALSGATITSDAVSGAVNAALYFVKNVSGQ